MAAFAAASGCVLAFATPASAATPSPWPQTYGTAALSHANNGEHILTASNVGKVGPLRTIRTTPSDEDCTEISPPVLSGGYIYAILNAQLKKIDAKTGRVVWSKSAPSYFVGLAVAGDTVVLDQADCLSQSDPDQTISAYNTASGALKWNAESQGIGNMVVSGAYVVTFGAVSGSSELAAFRLSNGSSVWTKDSGAEVSGEMAVVHGLVIHSWTNDEGSSTFVEADRLASGSSVWQQTAAQYVLAGDSDSSSGQNVVVQGFDNVVRDLDPSSGKARYTLSGATDVLAVAPLHVLADCGSGAVCGYDLKTGARQWRHTGITSGNAAAEANGLLYLAGGPVLRTSTGAQLANPLASTKGASAGAPAVGDGRLVVPFNPSNGGPSYLGVYGLKGY